MKQFQNNIHQNKIAKISEYLIIYKILNHKLVWRSICVHETRLEIRPVIRWPFGFGVEESECWASWEHLEHPETKNGTKRSQDCWASVQNGTTVLWKSSSCCPQLTDWCYRGNMDLPKLLETCWYLQIQNSLKCSWRLSLIIWLVFCEYMGLWHLLIIVFCFYVHFPQHPNFLHIRRELLVMWKCFRDT